MNKKKTISLLFASLLLSAQEFDISKVNSSDIDPNLLQTLSAEQLKQIEQLQSNDKDFLNENLDKEVDTESKIFEAVPEVNLIFGHSFLNTINNTNFSDLPISDDYMVGLGDNFLILLTGTQKKSFNTQVQSDGNIVFPELGLISVFGKPLAEVKSSIQTLIDESYVGVQAYVTLTKISPKKISIVGAVKKPGVYLVSPFTSVSGALAYANGVQGNASLRNIILNRSSGEKIEYDLYDLLVFGTRTKDVMLQAGDTIFVPATSNLIKITGEVNRPGIYEYTPDEKLENIISFALGFSGNANLEKISYDFFNVEELAIETRETNNLQEKIKGITQIDVFPIGFDEERDILVTGPIENPGFYKFEENETLLELLSNIEFTDKVYPFFGLIEQYIADTKKSEYIFFSPSDESTLANVNLYQNAKVTFIYKNEYSQIGTLANSNETLNALSDYVVEFLIDGLTYKLPIFGKYDLQKILNFLGIKISDIDETEIVLRNSNFINESINFKSQINSVMSQKVTLNKKPKLAVTGPVKINGLFELEKEILLSDFINNVGFIGNEFNPFVGVIQKQDPSNNARSFQLFSPSDTRTHNVMIDNHTKVHFFGRNLNVGEVGLFPEALQLVEDYTLRISYKGGTIKAPVFGSFKLRSLIDYFGLDTSLFDNSKTYYFQPLSEKEIIGDFNELIINSEKYHTLNFREKNAEVVNVIIEGEVNFPGRYILPASSTVTDLYNIVGGFKESAFEKNIVLLRDSVRERQISAIKKNKQFLKEQITLSNLNNDGQKVVNLDILDAIDSDVDYLGRVAGDFTQSGKNASDFILENGDRIIVPKRLNTVSIIGEVLSPNTVIWTEDLKMNSYIENAGGYTKFSDKRKVFVIKGNGEIIRKEGFIFQRNIKIEPGDVIVVPVDIKSGSNLADTILQSTSILYNFAFSAAALKAIENNP